MKPRNKVTLKYDQRLPAKSTTHLVLCLLIVFMLTPGIVYLFYRIHWLAGVVAAAPVYILLVDVLINKQKSIIWYFLDFIRHTLTFSGTAVITMYLWRIDWRIAAIAILPVLILLLNIVGFLTLHTYGITSEARTSKDAKSSFEQSNPDLENNDPAE